MTEGSSVGDYRLILWRLEAPSMAAEFDVGGWRPDGMMLCSLCFVVFVRFFLYLQEDRLSAPNSHFEVFVSAIMFITFPLSLPSRRVVSSLLSFSLSISESMKTPEDSRKTQGRIIKRKTQ